MGRSVRDRLLIVALAAAIASLVTLSVTARVSAQEAKVRLNIPAGAVGVDDAPFKAEVVAENAANLGAFEFDLTYDPSILGFVGVERGPFLGSSGRQVECLDPRVSPGLVRLVCVTLGAMPPGPDGSGVLATLTFDPLAPGTSPLEFQGAILAHPDGQRMGAAVEGASVVVGSLGPAPTPPTTGTAPAVTSISATPAQSTPAAPTRPVPTGAPTKTPPTTNASEDDGTNWALWGSVIGGAVVLVAASAGLAWWSRARRTP